jgi:hypothetical protein
MQSSFTRILSLSLYFPPVVDIVVSRLGLVCPPYGRRKEKEKEDDKERKKKKRMKSRKTKRV